MEFNRSKLKLVSESGQAFDLDKAARITVGRSRKNMMVMHNPHVSRRHAEIQFDGRHYFVIDLNSSNGTWLNGQTIQPYQPYPLYPNDRLTLATQVSLVVQKSASPWPSIPTAPGFVGELIDRRPGVDRLVQQPLSTDLMLVGVGACIVLLSFFLGWINASSPFANTFLADLVTMDLSGLKILTGYPELNVSGNISVLLVPLAALGALPLSIRRQRHGMALRTRAIIQIVLVAVGIGYMFLLLIGTQYTLDAGFRQLGMPSSVVGEMLIKIQPIVGFWTTCLGFILILAGALWTWRQNV